MFTRLVPRAGRAAGILLCVLLLVSMPALAACSARPASSGVKLAPPLLPEKTDFSTPKAAVLTYLDYTRYAYRMANSDLASQAASPYEGVRVDSYIELNRQSDKGIEQELTKFAEASESKVATTVVLTAKEDWKYRYFSLGKREYTSPMYTASYETTYTLVARPDGGWWVDKVDAKALTPVK